jgi:hypothetical protein
MMPLIECPDCYASVSDSAEACIRCGAPMAGGSRLKFPSSNKPIILIACGVIAAVFAWEAMRVVPGAVDSALRNHYGQSQHTAVTGNYAFTPEKRSSASGNTYSGGASSQANSPDKIYAIMNSKAMIVNREAPIMVNSMLKLTRVDYRHSTRTMTYNFQVKGDGFATVDRSVIEQGLQRRYCQDEEYRELRENGIAARFIYWDMSVGILETKVSNCRYIASS